MAGSVGLNNDRGCTVFMFCRTTESFLQRCERRSATPSSTAAHTSSMSKKVDSQETDQQTKGIKELHLEHKRVNQAFLDKLECKNRGMEMETHKKFSQDEEPLCLAPDDCRQETAVEKVSLTHLEPYSEQSCSNWTEETGELKLCVCNPQSTLSHALFLHLLYTG
ncbi:hypothetical protein XENOCAPTIV_016631 [Xenoophorus captivus]|uniref:Uncharacterized protein n=1 Tax=Xenoophorus captivus TaxID=1517983 RepID=A0ABV0QS92_9TELE